MYTCINYKYKAVEFPCAKDQ